MSAIVPLSVLEPVDLRIAWPNEASNFTPWLAEEPNLRALGCALGLDLILERIEKPVDTFSADILARDVISERYVLIENQLEQTDHSHLGQILTYAAGLDAQTVIWIAKSFREPHRAAIDYLNRISADDHNFFGVQMELYKIGNSDLAPRFNIVAKPNNWSKNISTGNLDSKKNADSRNEWSTYWLGFYEVAQNFGLNLRNRTPPREGWCRVHSLATGKNYATIYAHKSGERIRCVAWLQGNYPKALLEFLQQKQDEIQPKVKAKLIWDLMPNRQSSMVFVENSAAILHDADDQYKWMGERVREMIDALSPTFKSMQQSMLVPGEDGPEGGTQD
jgi:hypothetical protein